MVIIVYTVNQSQSCRCHMKILIEASYVVLIRSPLLLPMTSVKLIRWINLLYTRIFHACLPWMIVFFLHMSYTPSVSFWYQHLLSLKSFLGIEILQLIHEFSMEQVFTFSSFFSIDGARNEIVLLHWVMASGVSMVDLVTCSPHRRSLTRAQVVHRAKITIIMNNWSRHPASILSRASAKSSSCRVASHKTSSGLGR